MSQGAGELKNSRTQELKNSRTQEEHNLAPSSASRHFWQGLSLRLLILGQAGPVISFTSLIVVGQEAFWQSLWQNSLIKRRWPTAGFLQ